jgi:hypothetical protein
MNLVQLANDLEYVPKEQLAEMSQDPNASYPAYLVISEIQRRTLNEKNYQAMQPQPTTTVAEEVVGEFMQPQLAQNQPTGLQVGAPQATPLPSGISAGLSGVPTSAPMQMAASGGITGYANEGQTELNYSNLRTKLTEDEIKIVNQAVMRDRTQRMQSDLGDKTGKFLGGGANVSEQIFSVLSGGGGNIPIFRGSPEEKKFIEVANIILENKNKKASGGITGYANEGQTNYQVSISPKDELFYQYANQFIPTEGNLYPTEKGFEEWKLNQRDQTALEQSFNNPNANMSLQAPSLSDMYKLEEERIQKNIPSNQDIPKEVLEEVEAIGSSRGADFLKFVGVLREDGSIDPLGATLAVASLHPIGRAAGWAAKVGYGLGKKYLPGIATGLKGLVTKPNPLLQGSLKTGQRKVLQPDGTYKFIDNLTGKLINPTVFSAAKTAQTLGTVAVPAAIVKNIADSAQEQYAIDEEEKRLAALKAEAEIEEEKIKQGLAGAATAEKDNTGNWRDLARLGAGIMSAKNVGDIGGTVTNILDAQDKRELLGLQGKFTQAQTLKLEADIASMDKNSILARMTNLIKASEAGLITDMEAATIQYNALAAKLAELESQETKPASEDANVIASYG